MTPPATLSQTSDDQWLVRTTENQITGPFTLQQIRSIIQEGKLSLNDEICHANSYWFYLHERSEVQEQLGIEVPKQMYAMIEERTLTQTDSDIEKTDPEIHTAGSRMAATRLTAKPRENDMESLPELTDSGDGEATAVLNNRAFRDFRQKKKTDSAPGVVQVATPENPVGLTSPIRRRLPVEGSKVIEVFTYLMMVGAVGLLIAVIRLLQQQPG